MPSPNVLQSYLKIQTIANVENQGINDLFYQQITP